MTTLKTNHHKLLKLANTSEDGILRVTLTTGATYRRGTNYADAGRELAALGMLNHVDTTFDSTARVMTRTDRYALTDAGRKAIADRVRVHALIEELINEVA